MEINVSREELSKCKLMIATPAYGGNVHSSFTRSMLDLPNLCNQYGVQLSVYFLSNESLITRARNYCTDAFMRSDCTHLMFIDSDIGFAANDVIALLALTLTDKKYSIIGGPYPKKSISWEKIKYAVDKGAADENPDELAKYVGDFVFNLKTNEGFKLDEPVEVSELGTGFMMITRETLETYKAAFPEQMYRPDHARTADFAGDREIMCYFDCVIDRNYTFTDLHKLIKEVSEGNLSESELKIKATELLSREENASKRYLSEDYYFCYNAQRIGLQTWICPWMKLQHTGTFTFDGSLAEILMLGAHPTIDQETADRKKKK